MIVPTILWFGLVLGAQAGDSPPYDIMNIEDVCNGTYMETMQIKDGLIIIVNKSLSFSACIVNLVSQTGDGLILAVEYFQCQENGTRSDLQEANGSTRQPILEAEASYITQDGEVKVDVFGDLKESPRESNECLLGEVLYYQLHYTLDTSMNVLIKRNSIPEVDGFAYSMVFTPASTLPKGDKVFECVRPYGSHWINPLFACDHHVNCATVPRPLDENSCPEYLHYKGYDVTAQILKNYYWNFWFKMTLVISAILLSICLMLSLKVLCTRCRRRNASHSPVRHTDQTQSNNSPDVEKSSSMTYLGVTNLVFQQPPAYDSLFVNQSKEEVPEINGSRDVPSSS